MVHGTKKLPQRRGRKKARVVGEILEISTDRIRRMEGQPRTEFDQDELERLAATIRDIGQLESILVTRVEGDPEADFEILAGERRWRAVSMKPHALALITAVTPPDWA